jgi:hypothetical protein
MKTNSPARRSKIQPLILGLALILGQTQASWVDPDTPKEFRTTEALVDTDDREYKLVRPMLVSIFLNHIFL